MLFFFLWNESAEKLTTQFSKWEQKQQQKKSLFSFFKNNKYLAEEKLLWLVELCHYRGALWAFLRSVCTSQLWDKRWWKVKRYNLTRHTLLQTATYTPRAHSSLSLCTVWSVRWPSNFVCTHVTGTLFINLHFNTHSGCRQHICSQQSLRTVYSLSHAASHTHEFSVGEIWLLTLISGPLLLLSCPSGCPIRRQSGVLTAGLLSLCIRTGLTGDLHWHWG